jgi:hypothetical protein
MADCFDSDGLETGEDLTNSVTAKITEQVMIRTRNIVGKVPGPPILVTGVVKGSCNATGKPMIPKTAKATATIRLGVTLFMESPARS